MKLDFKLKDLLHWRQNSRCYQWRFSSKRPSSNTDYNRARVYLPSVV